MALADFQVVREKVSFAQGQHHFMVRGLALDDITILIRDKLEDLDELLVLYGDTVNDRVAVAATAQYAVALIKKSPDLVAMLIELASDEPGSAHQARRLPLPVQVEAIKKIVELTFREAGGAKNFIESLTSLLTAIRPAGQQTGSNT